MKKLIILAILTVSQMVFAVQSAKDAVRPLTLEQARHENAQRREVKEYKDALKSGKMTEQLRQSLIKLLTDSTSEVGGVDSTNLEFLVATRPEILDKVTQLSSLARKGTPEQQTKAAVDLRILSEASNKYELTVETVEVLEKVTEMADYNQAAKDFKAELLKTLRLGKAKSIEEAIKIASNGKITLEKIKECMI